MVRIPTGAGDIVGTLETPDGAPAPVVLMLHGFTGARDELGIKDTDEGVFSRTARRFAEAGVATLRIDFRGSGESDGAWADTTFSGQIADAVTAIDWLATDIRVDGTRISLLGWSQGGLVAAHMAAARPDVNSTVLWAPVVLPFRTYAAILGADTVNEAQGADGGALIPAKTPWGADVNLNAAFYQEFGAYSTAAAVAQYDGPLKVIVGLRDTAVEPQPALGEVLMRYHDGPEDLLVLDSDHVWNVFEGPQTMDQEMIPKSLAFIEAHN